MTGCMHACISDDASLSQSSVWKQQQQAAASNGLLRTGELAPVLHACAAVGNNLGVVLSGAALWMRRAGIPAEAAGVQCVKRDGNSTDAHPH